MLLVIFPLIGRAAGPRHDALSIEFPLLEKTDVRVACLPPQRSFAVMLAVLEVAFTRRGAMYGSKLFFPRGLAGRKSACRCRGAVRPRRSLPCTPPPQGAFSLSMHSGSCVLLPAHRHLPPPCAAAFVFADLPEAPMRVQRHSTALSSVSGSDHSQVGVGPSVSTISFCIHFSFYLRYPLHPASE